jgi:hypothetical protein
VGVIQGRPDPLVVVPLERVQVEAERSREEHGLRKCDFF